MIREIWTTTPPAVYALGCILLVLAALTPVLTYRAIERSRRLMQDQISTTDATLRQQIADATASISERIAQAVGTAEVRAVGIDQWLLPVAPLRSIFLADAFIDTRGRQAVPCPSDGRIALLVTAGQSNAANRGDGQPHTAGPQVLNFNLFDGRFYRAQDPLLGTSHTGINFATRLGDLLIETGTYDSVIIAPIAVASTRIEQWVPGSEFFLRLVAVSTYFYNFGIPITAVLWQHGEGNPCDNDEDAARYTADLRSIVRLLRGHFVEAPVYVALSTLCGGGANEFTRKALLGSVSTELNIRPGPDTDTLGHEYRYDMCHFNQRGTEAQARMWAETILADANHVYLRHFPARDTEMANSGN